MERIRIALVEDNSLFRDELCALLTDAAGIEVVGVDTHGTEARTDIVATQSDADKP